MSLSFSSNITPLKNYSLSSNQSIAFKSKVKNDLSQILFNKTLSSSSQISFGWSNFVSPQQQAILDVLTDPQFKNIMVTSHSNPDGDAYGSVIGICGLLKSLGKHVLPIINYGPKKTFNRMPSPDPANGATNYIASLTQDDLSNVKTPFDVAIILDSPEPNMLTDRRSEGKQVNKMLEFMLKRGSGPNGTPKKVIIIDHHQDELNEPTNETKWKNELAKYSVAPKNVLYCRELRAANAEIVAELDKEVADSYKLDKASVPNYDPLFNHKYRLGPAAGIVTDAAGTSTHQGEIQNTKFDRLSPLIGDEKVSRTRQMFNWLLDTSVSDKSQINMQSMISEFEVPAEIVAVIKDLVDGKFTVEDGKLSLDKGKTVIDGIHIKPPKKKNIYDPKDIYDPLGYICIDNKKALDQIADQLNNRDVDGRMIYSLIKQAVATKIHDDVNCGVFILANEGKDGTVFLSNRSYGIDNTNGENHIDGHVFCERLAMKITNALEPKVGTGGGHGNATGFKSIPGIDFEKDILPIAEKVVADYVKEKNNDLTTLPEGFKKNNPSFSAQMLNKVA